MANKRLLDAARLVDVSTSIAKQHYTLRRQQWTQRTQNSSLGRAVKTRTDKIAVTVAAAHQLIKRLNENRPSWEQTREHDDEKQETERAGPRGDTHGTLHHAGGSAGGPLSREKTSSQATNEKNDEGTSACHHSAQQRFSTKQGVSPTATTTKDSETGKSDCTTLRLMETSPDLLSASAEAMRKGANCTPAVPGQGDNQDGYTHPSGNSAEAIEHALAMDFSAHAFLNPRVSRSLGQRGPVNRDAITPRAKLPAKPLAEMMEASERWNQQSISAQQSAAATDAQTSKVDADMQALAASIAEELETVHPVSEGSSRTMRESTVPSTRFSRMWQYSSLATSMAFGAVGEGLRRFMGGAGQGSLILSESNMNRIVAKLSRMRGAALKLGQMISFQDSKVLPASIHRILQRVQDSADYMPAFQRDKVLTHNLGPDWRGLFSHFDEVPFAAASIGQVHKATLKSNDTDVAVKIQYPGVKNSIDSDLNNLSLLLTASQLLPKGLFLDKTIANARTELGWECDYIREANACIRFRDDLLIDDLDTFSVPRIYTEVSGPDVLTAEFMHGTAVAQLTDITQKERDWIGTQILRLCLRELMEWSFMQTDPNWTNFLYNRNTKHLELLDFGASRDFPMDFVQPYVSLLIAASNGDRTGCRSFSIDLGYLTGRESQPMLEAHVDSILTLAEPFAKNAPEIYDFEDQTITDRVRANIGLMLRERMAPPPEETYSLHRKLSGAFLLCAKLKSKVATRELFANAVRKWENRKPKLNL